MGRKKRASANMKTITLLVLYCYFNRILEE